MSDPNDELGMIQEPLSSRGEPRRVDNEVAKVAAAGIGSILIGCLITFGIVAALIVFAIGACNSGML